MRHHHIEKIKYKKHFFIKSFIVSFAIMIFVYLIGTLCFDCCANMAERLYGVDFEDYGKIFLTTFALWKILIIQFTLVPAIVMNMVENHIRKKEKHAQQEIEKNNNNKVE